MKPNEKYREIYTKNPSQVTSMKKIAQLHFIIVGRLLFYRKKEIKKKLNKRISYGSVVLRRARRKRHKNEMDRKKQRMETEIEI